MGGGGKGSSGKSTTTVRYAGYIESRHQTFLDIVASKRAAVIDSSPFSGLADIGHDVAFFGTSVLADFPSLYDMFGKFMAGLDIEVLFDQSFGDTMGSSQITDLVAAEGALLDDDLVSDALPRFQTGMRDINSVVSSSYVVGKALLEDTRAKNLSKFSAQLKYQLIPTVVDRWGRHLEWNKAVVVTYAELTKLYFSSKLDTEEYNREAKVKDKLWPFTVLEYERAALGALQGATTTTSKTAGTSGAGRAISGALGGAAMGGVLGATKAGAEMGLGGPTGLIVGGLIGLAGSIF